MGLQTFALWRLGEEDPSLWSIWDHPSNQGAPQMLKQVPPGDDVVTDGDGDILHITGEPHWGSRTIDMDSYNWTVTDEHIAHLSLALHDRVPRVQSRSGGAELR